MDYKESSQNVMKENIYDYQKLKWKLRVIHLLLIIILFDLKIRKRSFLH